MPSKTRAYYIRNLLFPDWKKLTEAVYGYATARNFPYTIKAKNKLLTKAHRLGLL